MLKTRWHRQRPKVAVPVIAAALIASLFSLAGVSPADAAGKDLSVGDEITFNDGSPASGVKVTVFEAASPFDRGDFLGEVFTGGDGRYQFPVGSGCYITVAIAPLGSSFNSASSGVVYDQLYGCVTDGPNNDFDSVLYRESVKPPPTTVPPTTLPPTTVPPTTAPPTTAPPTTAPPTTAPPTTLPPTTTTTVPKTTTTVKVCVPFKTSVSTNRDSMVSTIILQFRARDVPAGATLESVDLGPLAGASGQPGLSRNPLSGLDGYVFTIGIRPINGGSSLGFENAEIVATIAVNGKRQEVHLCGDGKVDRWEYSPIALDIDGSGTVERVSAEVEFDFAGNGEAVTVGEWFAPTEGILFDASISGPVTGEHLFGDQDGRYTDGFEKLTLLDTDADGQVAGAELGGLAIWTDANTNGRLDAGEQSSLADHGVVSLSTSHTNMVSVAALADGSTMVTEDLWFPAAGAAAATGNNLTSTVVLALAGIGLAGYAVVVGRRRRNAMDAELAAMLSDNHVS